LKNQVTDRRGTGASRRAARVKKKKKKKKLKKKKINQRLEAKKGGQEQNMGKNVTKKSIRGTSRQPNQAGLAKK